MRSRVGTACRKVQRALDDAMAEGTLSLPPELVAHSERCSHCKAEVTDLQSLFARLRGGAAAHRARARLREALRLP